MSEREKQLRKIAQKEAEYLLEDVDRLSVGEANEELEDYEIDFVLDLVARSKAVLPDNIGLEERPK